MPTIHTIYETKCPCPMRAFHHTFTTLGHINHRILFGAHCDISLNEPAYADFHELYDEINLQLLPLFGLQGGYNNNRFIIYLGSGDFNNPPNPDIPIRIGEVNPETDSQGNVLYRMLLDDTNQHINFISGFRYQMAVGDTCLSTAFELLA